MMFGGRDMLGFWLSDNGLEAALVRRRRRGWKLAGSARCEGRAEGEERRAWLARAFGECLKRLPRDARRADMPCVLAVPDRHVVEDVLSFADFPAAEGEARALVAHRVARETGDVPDDLTVAWEVVERDGGKVTCRVRAMRRDLVGDIEAAAGATGLRLVRIDGWTGFAGAAPELAGSAAGTAVWSDGREWSLVAWAEGAPAGFCLNGDEAEGAAADIVRLAVSFARSSGIPPGPLFAGVSEALAPSLRDAGARAGLEVTELPVDATRAAQVAAWG